MGCKVLHIILILGFTSVTALAQQPEEVMESALEQYAFQSDRNVEDDSRLQTLKSFLAYPLDLNNATAEDLKIFFFLNVLQIHALLQYRKLLGSFISIYELQAVPLWDLKTITNILPYVSVNNRNAFASTYSLREALKKGKLHILLRYKKTLEQKRGYKPLDSTGRTHYLGNPNAWYFRMQYKLPQYFNIGLTAESDAGEPFSGYGQKGFDFYSFHLFLENRGIFNALAIGDYKISFGQGLINKQGLSFGKTGMVMMIDRSGSSIRPHTSAMEYDFYRGMALNIGKKRWTTTLFISKKPEDANLLSEDTTYNYFHSLQSSGYHRSETELEDKGSIGLLSAGGNVRYDFGNGHVALNMVYHHFSDSMKRGNQLYQRFYPQGTYLMNASLDYALSLNKLYFFGETAVNEKGALATVNGLLMSVDRRVDVSLLYRNYSPEYTALYAAAFGESSRVQNESGLYLGVVVRPAAHWQLNVYSDFFRSPWLRYRIDAPSSGKEHFLQIDYTPSKKFKVYVRYRYKQKPINVLKEAPMAEVVNTQKQNLRLFMQWKLSDYFRIRNQIEGVYFEKGKAIPESGFMVYQNIRWETNSIWSGNFRVGYFHTDSYDSRIYTYENNVRYAFYIPSFYGEGLRTYINLRVDIGRDMNLWAKLARTWYFDRDVISSGWNEIKDNKRTKLIVELIWEL